MGSLVSSYITSKSSYLNNYILLLVCIYLVVDSTLLKSVVHRAIISYWFNGGRLGNCSTLSVIF